MRKGPSGLLIRELLAADAPALLAIHRRAIMATSDRFYTHEQRQSWCAGLTPDGNLKAAANGETFKLADTDGKVVAFCSRRNDAVIGLYVDPASQGRGIRHRLLLRAEAAFRQNKVCFTEIRASLPAVSFYEKEGYAAMAEETHRSRGGLPLAIKVMSKRLD